MKQPNVTEQLKVLKNLEPVDRVMDDIGQKIYKSLGRKLPGEARDRNIENSVSLTEYIKNNRWRTYLLLGVVLIVLVTILPTPISNYSKDFLFSARIAFAPTQYDKAKISLAYALSENQSFVYSRGKNSQNVKKYSETLAFANTEMSKLKLMGEEGKYSTAQCKELYREFHNLLNDSENYLLTLSIDNNAEALKLKDDIDFYHDIVENKLEEY